jgi:hypothetical protein
MTSPSTSMSPTTSTTACQAGDDDVEETSDGSDDGCNNRISIMVGKSRRIKNLLTLQDGGNSVNNSHEACSDCSENGFDLCFLLGTPP